MSDIADRLDPLTIGSCSCGIKTDDTQYHASRCVYRVVREAQLEIERLEAALATMTADLQVARTGLEAWRQHSNFFKECTEKAERHAAELEARLAAAEARGFARGVEAAAKWHEDHRHPAVAGDLRRALLPSPPPPNYAAATWRAMVSAAEGHQG